MDDKKNLANCDPNYINILDPDDLRRWADKFDVTNAKLKAAVNTVGTSAKKVEAYLRKSDKF